MIVQKQRFIDFVEQPLFHRADHAERHVVVVALAGQLRHGTVDQGHVLARLSDTGGRKTGTTSSCRRWNEWHEDGHGRRVSQEK